MTISRSLFLAFLGTAAVAVVVVCLWEFSPQRQVGKAFARLTTALEDRDWEEMRSLMAEDYRDAWGQNKQQAVQNATEVFRQFFVLEVTAENPRITVVNQKAEVLARLKLAGKGTGLAEAALQRVNDLQGDFQFAWKRESWVPWSWKLVSVNQSEIFFDPSWLP